MNLTADEMKSREKRGKGIFRKAGRKRRNVDS
jgi:hypothetical protein